MATSSMTIKVDGTDVTFQVPSAIKAYFNEQFVRDKPSQAQKKKYTTLMRLMELAYKAGQSKGP